MVPLDREIFQSKPLLMKKPGSHELRLCEQSCNVGCLVLSEGMSNEIDTSHRAVMNAHCQFVRAVQNVRPGCMQLSGGKMSGQSFRRHDEHIPRIDVWPQLSQVPGEKRVGGRVRSVTVQRFLHKQRRS